MLCVNIFKVQGTYYTHVDECVVIILFDIHSYFIYEDIKQWHNNSIEPYCLLFEGLLLYKLHVLPVLHDHSGGYMTNFIDLSCPNEMKKCQYPCIKYI